MGGLTEMYRNKLVTAEEAAGKVKSGDWVFYSHFAMFPKSLDRALAKRAGELKDVKVRGVCAIGPVEIAQADPEKKSFTYHSGFFGHQDRKLGDKGLSYYIPSNYGEAPALLREGHAYPPDVAMISTTDMDDKGFFNFSVSCSYARAICEKARTLVLEINRSAPRCLGGAQESVHISEVDYIVEGDSQPLATLPDNISPTEEEKAIAGLVAEEIEDGCCLQLGIGGMPNTIGRLIAESGLKDLGVHSEMMNEAFMDLFEKGQVTGSRKGIDRYKMTYTFALGSQKLYDFLDNNPACATYPVDMTNSVARIARNDKQIAINNAIEVDLYGQICSESAGFRQISGTGGQLEFTLGAYHSSGGKAFICMRSTTTSGGERVSRIVPWIRPGGVVTVPRTISFYVVTEYGKVNLKGKSTWKRAELLIGIAHPDYREGLIAQAEKMGIWTRSNKMA